MSIDKFFHRRYDVMTYNCAHFVCEVWEDLTGDAISYKLAGLLCPPKDRRVAVTLRHEFKRLGGPVSPCIALMQRPRTAPHVGIFLNGRILHLNESGVEFQPIEIASFGFKTLEYYKC